MTTAIVGATCANCPFHTKGICRRGPPLAAVGAGRIWPTVVPEDWCGEHPAIRHRFDSVVMTGAQFEFVPPPAIAASTKKR